MGLSKYSRSNVLLYDSTSLPPVVHASGVHLDDEIGRTFSYSSRLGGRNVSPCLADTYYGLVLKKPCLVPGETPTMLPLRFKGGIYSQGLPFPECYGCNDFQNMLFRAKAWSFPIYESRVLQYAQLGRHAIRRWQTVDCRQPRLALIC